MIRPNLRGLLMAGAVVALPALAHAQTASDTLVVVAPAPLGATIAADKLPGTTEVIGASSFAKTGTLSVTTGLQQYAAGVSLSDTQGNQFTEDLDFRGFKASPLQGTPEGLAVYMGGVRLNESFGDTVNWDLIPETAIRSAELFSSNPAFGLNALGGAVNLSMKTGADLQGVQASVQGGSFGGIYAGAEGGFVHGPWSGYLAADGGHDDGWRIDSPSSVARFYSDLGWEQGRAALHLVVTGGQNYVGVVGPTPVDLISANPKAVYTYPQTTTNQAGMAALNGKYTLDGGWAITGGVYGRLFSQNHLDGNDGDFEGCARTGVLAGTLCAQDDAFPAAIRPAAAAFQVLGPNNVPVGCPPLITGQTKLCNGIPYGSDDRTRTVSTTWGISAQATRDSNLFGHGNLFAAGAGFDRGVSRFSSNSTLGIINPDLSVTPQAGVPGQGLVVHTAGNVEYSPSEARTVTEYAGLYASDSFDILPALTATVSGRMNLAHVALSDLTGTNPGLSGGDEFDRFNPSAGLAWKATPWATVYGGYSEANRAPTALELGCSNPAQPCLIEDALVSDPPLKQVVSKSFEGGVRGRADYMGHEQWRVSAFHTDIDDDIVALASVIQGRGNYTNVPRTLRQGVEAEVNYAAANWRAYASYSYVDATYQFSGQFSSPNSPFADGNGNILIQKGDRIGGEPAHRLKAGAEVDVLKNLTVGADLLYIGSQYYAGDESNQDVQLPDYYTVALRGEYRLTPKFAVFARIDNLLDRRYATYGTYWETDGLDDVHPNPLPNPNNPDPHSVTQTNPRSFQLGVKANW